MRKNKLHYVALMALVVLAGSLISSGAFADTFGFWFNELNQPVFDCSKPYLLGGDTAQQWLLTYTAGATISPQNSNAKLTGSFNDKIWNFEYSATGADDDWQSFGTLVSTFSATPNHTTPNNEDGIPIVVTAKYIRMGYNCELTTDRTDSGASASGTASVTATLVPEPSSLLALGLGIIPLIGLRKRSK